MYSGAYYSGVGGLFSSGNNAFRGVQAAPGVAYFLPGGMATAPGPQRPLAAVSRVRRKFPEAWIWIDDVIG